jgi:hypothetical protein
MNMSLTIGLAVQHAAPVMPDPHLMDTTSVAHHIMANLLPAGETASASKLKPPSGMPCFPKKASTMLNV